MEELTKYDTITLLKELMKRSPSEIQLALLTLLLNRKVDYVTLSNQYTKALELWHDDDLDKLYEAESCVAESFHYSKDKNGKNNQKHIKRCLYLLNKSNSFVMNKLNEKYGYDEADAKQSSVYERNKKEKEII